MHGHIDAAPSSTMTKGIHRKAKHRTFRLLPRQQLLISLLGAFDCPVPNLQFQKLLFLYCQESDEPSRYQFVPYRFGAFSFTSYADRRKLTDRGLLIDEASIWQLTPSGRRAALDFRQPAVDAFVDRHRMVPVNELVAESYRRHPYFAIRSEIAKTTLGEDRAAMRNIEAARPRAKPITLLTIGYEGRSLECYLNLLLQAGVTLLCDVRRNAVSRKYGFAKSTLGNACTTLGIRYEHLPQLGISAEQRRSLSGQEDYQQLFSEYEKHHLPRQQDALRRAIRWIESRECVALTCYERDVDDCHRSRIALEIDRRIDMRAPLQHL